MFWKHYQYRNNIIYIRHSCTHENTIIVLKKSNQNQNIDTYIISKKVLFYRLKKYIESYNQTNNLEEM